MNLTEITSARFIVKGLVSCTMEESVEGSVWTRLRDGSAWFEIVEPGHGVQLSPPFSPTCVCRPRSKSLFFAKIGLGAPSARQAPPAAKKVEHYTVHRVAGDGRCMFRALVLGLAANKGMCLNGYEEKEEADQLRLAVKEALCTSEKERRQYEEALIAVTVDESLKRYCQRITTPQFWGGESELLVLSRMLSQPIVVYIPESELKQGSRWGAGFIPITEYGSEFTKSVKDRKGRKPVRLLYSGSNHYDLLI